MEPVRFQSRVVNLSRQLSLRTNMRVQFKMCQTSAGSSDINLWQPIVDTVLQQVFSLSQQWYVNFIGPISDQKRQTVEGGWQVYSKKYKSPNPVLFIFWTNDNYENFKKIPKILTNGCYNMDCPGFVFNGDDKKGGLSP